MQQNNVFTKTALIAVLVKNDMHYMHLLSNGEDFDKSHELTQSYYERLGWEVDDLMELALEASAPICNPTLANQVVPDYLPEDKASYDYPTIVISAIEKLAIYVSALRGLRNETDNGSIQSKLDDMIRYWEKEINYKLQRRVVGHPVISGFINTGLDDRIAGMLRA